jgi:hypothetical protein
MFSSLQTVRSSKDLKSSFLWKRHCFFNETLVAEKVHFPNFFHPVILFVRMHDGFVGTVVPKSFVLHNCFINTFVQKQFDAQESCCVTPKKLIKWARKAFCCVQIL